ncbi:hypothetical protein C8J57DRAFT_1469097 [Mycena rebaudengoi]|nr:hypothetical protein C8J57DRAFT_1469097 [Mycena rebaudengoi]
MLMIHWWKQISSTFARPVPRFLRTSGNRHCSHTPLLLGITMPLSVQTIDVNSPLIMYSGPWKLGGADGDPNTLNQNLVLIFDEIAVGRLEVNVENM